jgi:hypothetical protein
MTAALKRNCVLCQTRGYGRNPANCDKCPTLIPEQEADAIREKYGFDKEDK